MFSSNDTTQHTALLAAIGSVAQNSASLSHQLVQLVETIAGTGLTYALLDDGTLGSQVKRIAALVKRLNSNEWLVHPPIEPTDVATARSILRDVDSLIQYRNRLVHDVWWVFPTAEHADAIEGHPPTRWAAKSIRSSIRTVHIVAGALDTAAAATSDLETVLVSRNVLTASSSVHTTEKLRTLCEGIRSSNLPQWRWEAVD